MYLASRGQGNPTLQQEQGQASGSFHLLNSTHWDHMFTPSSAASNISGRSDILYSM